MLLNILGETNIKIRIGNISIQHEVIISNDITTPIIGNNVLKFFTPITIDYEKQILIANTHQQPISFNRNQLIFPITQLNYNVCLEEDIQLPPNSEVFVLTPTTIPKDLSGIIEPSINFFWRTGLHLARTITPTEGDSSNIRLRFINPTKSTIVIPKGSTIGKFEEFNDFSSEKIIHNLEIDNLKIIIIIIIIINFSKNLILIIRN